jgi:hypothetical protein
MECSELDSVIERRKIENRGLITLNSQVCYENVALLSIEGSMTKKRDGYFGAGVIGDGRNSFQIST